MTMIRIVIADDHTIMREGLKRILDGANDSLVLYYETTDTIAAAMRAIAQEQEQSS